MASTLQAATQAGSNGEAVAGPGRPTTIKSRRSWRPGLLALSLFLIVGSMLAGLWLYQSTTSRVGVLVAATDLQPGDRLEVTDTRVQYVAAEPEFLAPLFTEEQAVGSGFYGGSLELTVGRPLPAGSPLVREYLLTEETLIPADKTVVGVSLGVGEYPNAIASGNVVALHSTSSDDEQLDAVLLGEAEVWSAQIDPNSGALIADLIVEVEEQSTIVQAHRNDLLRLTLVAEG